MTESAVGPRDGEPLVFSVEEYQSRLSHIRTEMRAQKVDMLLVTSPENIYYLTGYRTTGYYMYQCLLVPLDSFPRFVVRKLEMTNVLGLSLVKDGLALEDNADPLDGTIEGITACGGHKGRIGFEDQGFFLTPRVLAGVR